MGRASGPAGTAGKPSKPSLPPKSANGSHPAPRSPAGPPLPGTGAAKPTVVLRAGPPPSKGRMANIVTGVLGALLLIAAVLLVNALPKVDVPPNEFRVTYETETFNLTSQSAYLTDSTTGGGNLHSFEFNITHDNVYEATFQLTFTDDVVASAPDSFRFELRDPGGEVRSSPDNVIANYAASLRPNSTTEYEAKPATVTMTVVLTPKPQPAIVTAREGATAEEVEEALTKQSLRTTTGTWTIRVILDLAGDCIQPQTLVSPTNPVPSQDDLARFTACRQETSDPNDPQSSGVDPGNEITVGVFTYSRFVVHAEEFG